MCKRSLFRQNNKEKKKEEGNLSKFIQKKTIIIKTLDTGYWMIFNSTFK